MNSDLQRTNSRAQEEHSGTRDSSFKAARILTLILTLCALAGAPLSAQTPGELYQRGLQAMRSRQYPQAIGALRRAVELDPSMAKAHGALGTLYFQMNRLDEAKETYIYLFPRRRDLADRLMGAMQNWVEEKKREPSGVDPTMVDDFSEWVAHRSELAQQTAAVGAK